jgi:hypothetical protein
MVVIAALTVLSTNDVPENLCRNEIFYDRAAIIKDRHARIIIMRPETRLH